MSTLLHNVLASTLPLSFEQTVPRSLVHKRSLENVLLTSVNSDSDDRFVCGGRIPRAHNFFNEAGRFPQNDLLFYTELGRQGSIAVSHEFLGAGKDQVFIFEHSQATLTTSTRASVLPAPSDVIIVDIKIKEKATRKNGTVSRVAADYIMYNDRERVFQGTGTWSMQPQALFERLRRMSATSTPALKETQTTTDPPASPWGERDRTPNAVIAVPTRGETESEFVTSLIVDRTHPYFFDHPCDHVPGMLLLEGCGQLARSAAAQASRSAAQLYACDVNFAQFVELGVPTTLTARVSPANINADGIVHMTATVIISQRGLAAGTATLRLELGGPAPAMAE